MGSEAVGLATGSREGDERGVRPRAHTVSHRFVRNGVGHRQTSAPVALFKDRQSAEPQLPRPPG